MGVRPQEWIANGQRVGRDSLGAVLGDDEVLPMHQPVGAAMQAAAQLERQQPDQERGKEKAEAAQRISKPRLASAARMRSRPFIDLIGPRRFSTRCVQVAACSSWRWENFVISAS